ncbi:MAG TPA: hypothetical protein DCP91_12835 [Eggerthellaceae bacterium]|nr:hypothetical protein [Eggerthellaceae bacterium]
MNPFSPVGQSVLPVAAVLLFLCAAAQVVHGYLRLSRNDSQSRRSVAIYEGALLAHLMVTCMGAAVLVQAQGSYDSFPSVALLWANVAVALAVGYVAILGFGDTEDMSPIEDPSWMPPLEVVLACACVPPALAVFGEGWPIILLVDALYYLFRTVFLLLLDLREGKRVVSRMAVAEATKLLPEGLLYADGRGRVQLANDAMVHCLTLLGLGGSPAQIEDLWHDLEALAAGERRVEIAHAAAADAQDGLFVLIAPDEIRRFVLERLHPPIPSAPKRTVTLHRFGSRILAYDVTEEVRVLQGIDRANAELVETQRQIVASMRSVQEAAANEALLRMRARVHDVVGQRLSMLHRAIEDDDISDEQISQLRPLLNGILDDLAMGMDTDPAEELDATVAAFALAGVTVEVQGALPEDSARARVFADCVREAATNAVKHARAMRVDVLLSETSVSVSNDGPLPTLPLRDGTGLASMRRAAASVGAGLRVEAMQAPFTIRIVLLSDSSTDYAASAMGGMAGKE